MHIWILKIIRKLFSQLDLRPTILIYFTFNYLLCYCETVAFLLLHKIIIVTFRHSGFLRGPSKKGSRLWLWRKEVSVRFHAVLFGLGGARMTVEILEAPRSGNLGSMRTTYNNQRGTPRDNVHNCNAGHVNRFCLPNIS